MARKNDFIKTVDILIGNKIYDLRLAKGLSRQQLSDHIGVTHQQLQKYEKGTNRVSVGRLALIAQALGENMLYFYDGLQIKNLETKATQHQRMCLEIARNFMRIRKAEHQVAVNTLVRKLKESA